MVTRRLFEERLQGLHESLLTMGVLVEESIFKSVKSLVERDSELASDVVTNDQRINELEVEIEKKCFELIATQQPVGSDLRQIGTMLKVSTDLERMADHAVSIAKTTLRLQGEAYIKPLIDIPRMGELVKQIVRDGLEAYIELDQEKAVEVAKKDDQIDALYSQIFIELIDLMKKDAQHINQASNFLLVAQHLERIGDYVTNVCEWIVYMKTANLVDLNK